MKYRLCKVASSGSFAALLVATAWSGCGSDVGGDGAPGLTDAGMDTQGDRPLTPDVPYSDGKDSAPLYDADAKPEDGAVPPWDPVWHKTTPAAWAAVPKVPLPDCGAGCRVLGSTLPDGFPNRAPKASDRWVIMQGWPSGVFGAEDPRAVAIDMEQPGEPLEFIVDDAAWLAGAWGVGGVAVDGDFAVYVVGSQFDGYVVLANLATGERKLVWRVPMESAMDGGHPGTSATVLALPYIYWLYSGDYAEGMWRFDTRDGSLKTSYHAGACEIISGTSAGLGACASAGVGLTIVDFDNDTATVVPEGIAWRSANGMLSQDGKDAVWIDFRDPGANGEHGSYDSPWGGELYHRNLETHAEERLTFDTPNTPTMKTAPWAQNGSLAWVTLEGTSIPNPTGSSVYWYSGGFVVVTRPGSPPVKLPTPHVGFPRPVGPGIVAAWFDDNTERGWVVLLDWPAEVGGAK